ncbi:hypothetical protein [Bradyrhizobium uaiense]|uniref:Uncharacterized protein n=1 Tax=Bradyrhizobium uaiense TaxID=2594946 RepID=A0A6P1BEI1_9BRAD|nr:hypothetical protein [Bradyrhizobium uaiense]NEU96030.1 hypothetical protein [Bradyrhizobium uaiense]
MTEAVCFNCGDLKWGAFSPCGKCGALPTSDDALMLSLAFTDHYFDRAGLQQIGRDIAAGRLPQLDEATKEKLRPAILEAKRIIGIGRYAKRPDAAPKSRLSLFSRLFGKKPLARPFYANASRDERQEWFARTPPWNEITPKVIAAILEGISDKVLLEAFVLRSTKTGLVARYKAFNHDDFDTSKVIRAGISQILCETGNRAIETLREALAANRIEAAKDACIVAADTFEPAIALAQDQLMAYVGMATLCGLCNKRAECHDYAERGLRQLALARREEALLVTNGVIPAGAFDQIERQLRSFLTL